ncbi:MAG: hypothetical protein RRC34_16045 [Lentisphaeria bacterium]|nr:hypothetical protein [Lentisphaeria bacterium]
MSQNTIPINIAQLQDFLAGYTSFDPPPALPPTLMDIAGFPHWENVYSNILAFFLDGSREHGFGNLMVRAMLEAYFQKAGKAEE